MAQERRVVFYDQLGAGNSAIEAEHDPAMWTPELFVEEVGVVREALGLERVHVLGHSWGGMLGMQYAATQPDGLVSLIVGELAAFGACLDGRAGEAARGAAARGRGDAPPHEEAGTTNSAEYQQAEMEFYKRHLCRVDPWPDWLNECFSIMLANPEVYNTMNGPSEFHVIGTLRDWDITPQLGRIQAPTLLFCGRYDEVTPASVEVAHRAIPGSEFVVMEESSHMSQAEEPEATLELVRGFLARVEE